MLSQNIGSDLLMIRFFSHSALKVPCRNFLSGHYKLLVSGKMPPGKKPPPEKCPLENCPPENYPPEISPPRKLPPGKKPLGKMPPGKLSPRKIVSLDFCCF